MKMNHGRFCLIFLCVNFFSTTKELCAQEYYPPLSSQVDVSSMPSDILVPEGESGESLLEKIRINNFLYTELENGGVDIGATLTGKLILQEGITLGIPGVDPVKIVIGEGKFDFSLRASEWDDPADPKDQPYFFTMKKVPLRLRITSDFLVPVREVGGNRYEVVPGNTELVNTVDIEITYTWEGEAKIELKNPENGTNAVFSFSNPVMIGETGIILNAQGVHLDLSGVDKGIYFDEFSVAFAGDIEMPKLEKGTPSRPELASIQLEKFFLGNAGFNGVIKGTIASGELVFPLFGMDFLMTGIDMEFKQSSLIKGGLMGTIIRFPFFEKPVDINLALDTKGNFKIALAANSAQRGAGAGALVTWTIDEVLDLKLQSISFEHRDHIFYTRIDGTLIPKFSDGVSASGDEGEIGIKGLTITSEGDVSLEGGWITLPKKRYIDFNAFKVELSEVGFGTASTTGTGQKWFGFSGGIELSEGLATAKVKQIKFLWPRKDGDDGLDVEVSGIEIGYSNPGVVTFKGSVEWFKDPAPGGKKGFAGKVDVNLESLTIQFAGRLVIGKQYRSSAEAVTTPVGDCVPKASASDYSFFFIEVDVQLPTGIPVFSNVSVYGLVGLFAYNMEPQICAFSEPLEWFEKHRNSTNIVSGTAASPAPWVPANGSYSFGIGVILGTTSDNGYSINVKSVLIISTPGPLVMLTGAGNILKKRGKINSTDPLFNAIAIYDHRKSFFSINLELFYKQPQSSGDIIDLKAQASAFFNLNDPTDWHLWLGQKTPESKRLKAKIFKFLSANAYLMIDPDEFQFGASAGYDSRPKWKFGPLRVKLTAMYGYDMVVSWRPTHAAGKASLIGSASLKIWGYGVDLGVNADVEAKTPTPYLIKAAVTVRIGLPWPMDDRKAKIKLKWEKDRPKSPISNLVTGMALQAAKSHETDTINVVRDISITTGTAVDIPVSNVIVPVDYKPVVSFARNTNENLSGANQPTLTGNAGGYLDEFDDATFEYNLSSVKIWKTPKTSSTSVTFTSFLEDVYGAWPAVINTDDRPGALFLKLWSKNPFNVYESSTANYLTGDIAKSWTEKFVSKYPDYPCPPGKKEIVYNDKKVMDSYKSASIYLADAREFAAKVQVNNQSDESYNAALYHAQEASRFKLLADYYKHEPIDMTGPCFQHVFLEQKDLILPPYHIFALAIESQAVVHGTGSNKQYQDVGYFATEGFPLNLDPYVDHTIPDHGLLYRGYDLGLHFNETYLDLMYQKPDSDDSGDWLYKHSSQDFFINVVDDNGQPIRDLDGNQILITTRWELAPDHIRLRTDDEWLSALSASGVTINEGILPKDDMVYARPNWAGGLKGSTRYTAQVWYKDDRLATDSRTADVAWLTKNKVRAVSADRKEVLLYSFPFITSKYESFNTLMTSFENKYWLKPVGSFTESFVDEIVNQKYLTLDVDASVSPSEKLVIGGLLYTHNKNKSPEKAQPTELRQLIKKLPGFDGDVNVFMEADLKEITSAWAGQRKTYMTLEEHFDINTLKEPLPEQVELSLLRNGENNFGFLLELPESIEWGRVKLTITKLLPDEELVMNPLIVESQDGARAFIFMQEGGHLQSITEHAYRFNFELKRNIGSRNPILKAADGLETESATWTLDLATDKFN